MSAVLSTLPASPAAAAAHFAAKLAFETDVSDVRADLEAGVPGLVVVDTRSIDGWAAGHLPGAIHLPTREITARAAAEIPRDSVVVTYCWGPGCNGSTRAALAFAQLGYAVKEMIGGYEYWVREGFPTMGVLGRVEHEVDPLTAPATGVACAC